MKRDAIKPASTGITDQVSRRPAPGAPVVGHAAPLPRGPSTAQVLLGLFILWQLFFLFTSNLFSVATTIRDDEDYQKALPPDSIAVMEQSLPGWLEKKGHLHHVSDHLIKITDHWGELLAQVQAWSLFAPEISSENTFVGVELRWEDPDEEEDNKPKAVPHPKEFLRSHNEPENLRKFFRLGKFRLRKYESNLDVVLRILDKETPKEAAERWAERIKKKVNKEWDTIPAYLKMRYEEFRKDHPELQPPKQVILVVRRYKIPKPDKFSETWYEPPHQVPIARCRLSVVEKGNQDEIKWEDVEWFNPTKINAQGEVVEGQFERTGNDNDEND